MVKNRMIRYTKLINLIKACTKFLSSEKILVSFITIHIFIATILGRFYLFAPDEIGYLNTFNNLYGGKFDYPQTVSGWITSPTYFLRIIFLPAKILNIIGIPDILSLRYCTIMFASMVFRILQLEIRNSHRSKRSEWLLLFFFLTPTVLLWSSIGLRETYIYFSLALILGGLRRLEQSQSKISLFIIFIGSFVLICTKFYLWICIALSTFLVLLLIMIKKSYWLSIRPLRHLGITLIVLPLLLFLLAAPNFAVSFAKEAVSLSKIQNASARSGDSISITSPLGEENAKVILVGNSTATALQDYLSVSKDTFLFKLLEVTGLSKKLSATTNSFVINNGSLGTESKDSNPYALETPSITSPLNLFIAITRFILGPFPIFNDYGFIMASLSWESMIWWMLYGIVIYRMGDQFRRRKLLDLRQIFSLVFIFIFIILSALVEVNVGTALRHRSVLLIPLLTLLMSAKKDKQVF